MGGSGRQLAAALAAAGGDDGPTGAGPHAQPEAMRLGPPAVVGLKGPLAHGEAPSVVRCYPGRTSGPFLNRYQRLTVPDRPTARPNRVASPQRTAS